LLHVEIQAEPLLQIGPLTFTNSMVGALLTTVLLLLAAWFFLRRASLVPSRVQSLVEFPIEWTAQIVKSNGGTHWRSFAPLVVTIFIFVLLANWIGLLPGVGTIGYHEIVDGEEVLVPFVRPASADLNFTLGLALVSFFAFIGLGVRKGGIRAYLKHTFIAEPAYMTPLMTPIHIISELSRLISLSFRLFGNVFAGEVLLATMLFLTTAVVFVLPLAFFVPAVFLSLELVFGFVQALVFAFLTMAYIVLALPEHEEHEEHGSPDAEAAPPPTNSSHSTADPAHGAA
jgi:F-type H+-transporting ATPase subunit a